METQKKSNTSFKLAKKNGVFEIRMEHTSSETRPTAAAPSILRRTIVGLFALMLALIVITGCGIAWHAGSMAGLAILIKALGTLIGAVVTLMK